MKEVKIRGGLMLRVGGCSWCKEGLERDRCKVSPTGENP